MSQDLSEWFTAIQKGDAASVESQLRAHPGRLTARDAGGVSSVTWACYARQARILATLLAAGPQLDVFEAVAAGDEVRARALLREDPALALAWSADGFTALHLAAFFSRPALASLLLECGADPGVAARNPMIVAPLHSAAAASATDVARLLLARGADPNARQAQGFTALMGAAQAGNAALAELLLAHGAAAGARCDDGRAAADLADQKAHHALAASLRAVGG